MQPDEELEETVGVDLPPHRRTLHAVDVDQHGRTVLRICSNDAARVVVDAEEVEWSGDRRQIAVFDRGEDRCEGLEHVRGVLASEHRVQDPAIA